MIDANYESKKEWVNSGGCFLWIEGSNLADIGATQARETTTNVQ